MNTIFIDGMPCRRVGGRLLIRYDHAAKYRACAKGTIANDVHAGRLKAYRLGRHAYVEKSALDQLLFGDQGVSGQPRG